MMVCLESYKISFLYNIFHLFSDTPKTIHWLGMCTLSCTGENRNATNYVWLLTIVILFYILPVLQVAVTYQGVRLGLEPAALGYLRQLLQKWGQTNNRKTGFNFNFFCPFLFVLMLVWIYLQIVNDTGNDDICYYNFLCALPNNFGLYIMDFNHVLSNIGYIFLGIVFIILTHLKSIRDCTKHKQVSNGY